MPGRARRVSQGPSVAAGTRRSGCAPSRCSVIAQRGGLNILGFLHTHKTAMVGNMLTPWGVVASFDRVYTSSSAPQCERKGTPGGPFLRSNCASFNRTPSNPVMSVNQQRVVNFCPRRKCVVNFPITTSVTKGHIYSAAFGIRCPNDGTLL